MTKTSNGARHMVYALSLTDGSVVSGWPLDMQALLTGQGVQRLDFLQCMANAAHCCSSKTSSM